MSARVRSRAGSHADRSGDPLDGLVNMFDLGVVLAVAFLLAALAAFKLTGVLNGQDTAVVTRPGSPDQTIVAKRGDHLEVTQLTYTRRPSFSRYTVPSRVPWPTTCLPVSCVSSRWSPRLATIV